MIRFRCQECDKKLKADESIIGRRVKCTRCGNIEEVPSENRLERKFAKGAFENNTKSDMNLIRPESSSFDFLFDKKLESQNLIPDVGSEETSLLVQRDEKFGSDELAEDLGSRNGFPVVNSSNLAAPSPGSDRRFRYSPDEDHESNSSKKKENQRVEETASNSALDVIENRHAGESLLSAPSPGRQFALKKKKEFKGQLIAVAAGLLGLAIVGLTLYFLSGNPSSSRNSYDDAFRDFREVKAYYYARLQLEKAGRVYNVMRQALIKTGQDTDDVASELKQVQDSIEELTIHSTVLDEAFELYQQEESDRAKEMVLTATQTMNERKLEIDLKTNEIMKKRGVR
ncbi:MAG: hypothetical protein AAF939_09515 [Planctomycetota bacterium]